ncbi:MAG TPA: HAMP domain-containing sensor histidine kinase [Actinomycetota bacterium]|nr:HAMP domain-containing sensor histidine kinase [Actinomycetota bacterium]
MKRGRSLYAKRAMPLSLRVASIYAMLVAATLLVAAGLALQFTRNQVSGQVDNQLNGLAKSFDTKVKSGVNDKLAQGWELSAAVVTETYAWLQNTSFPDGEGAVVAIRTAEAPKLFRPSGSYDLSHELESVLPSVMSVSTGKWLNVRSRSGAAVRLLRVPIQDASGHVAGILVLGAQQSKVVNHAVWNLLKGIGAASAIGLVFATTLGLVAVRRTLRPLEEMSHEVESIQETDDLSKRLSGRGPRDEVGRLAEGFDRMLGRLQEAFLSQRRFLSDASHELRTPMTVVRGQLELLAMDVESLTGRRSMSIAIEELDRMGRIVEDLLLLARLDEGMPLARDSVEVELVVGEALLRAMLGAGDVRVEVVPELCILGDADRLLQVLTNLITNAVRHGRNAPITVTGRPEGDYVRIEVSDQGPGISPEDLPHVFERLYRGSKARSESPGGAGLGLAIALSLVKAMDGWIEVHSTLGVGTTFAVTLPSAAPVGRYRMPVRQHREATAL